MEGESGFQFTLNLVSKTALHEEICLISQCAKVTAAHFGRVATDTQPSLINSSII